MKRVISLSEKRKQKIVQSARDLIDDVMDGGASEEELDRRLDSVLNDWQRHKEQTESEGIIMIEKIFTPKEVAEHLKIAEKTIVDYLREGTINGFKIGREWRVRESDLQAFIDGKVKIKRSRYKGLVRHKSDGTWTGKISRFPEDTTRQPGEAPAEVEILFTIGPVETRKEVQEALLVAFEQMKKEGKIATDERLSLSAIGGGKPEKPRP